MLQGVDAMRLFNLLKDICLKLGMVSDYVVETGTSGIWNYRKWASGTAECWGRHSAVLKNYSSNALGHVYYTTVNFPSGLFVAEAVVNWSSQAGNGWSYNSGTRSGLNSITMYGTSNIQASATWIFWMHAIGRWK